MARTVEISFDVQAMDTNHHMSPKECQRMILAEGEVCHGKSALNGWVSYQICIACGRSNMRYWMDDDHRTNPGCTASTRAILFHDWMNAGRKRLSLKVGFQRTIEGLMCDE